MKKKGNVGSERGTALVVSLLLLLVLTLIALSLINTSTFEISVSGNERATTEAFYAAEAGLQRALSQLPAMEPIPQTKIGSDSTYWSGTVRDRTNPTRPLSLGLAFQYGNELFQFGFRRVEIHITGESGGAVRELEAQVKVSRPISPSTEY